MELMTANAQWSTRPADQRYLSLTDMLAFKSQQVLNSRAKVVPSKQLRLVPHQGTVMVEGANGVGYEPTHWAFGQLAQLAGAPAGYLRTLPAELASDDINYGLQFNRQAEEVGVLLQRPVTIDGAVMREGNVPAAPQFVAATGPKYGRIWDRDILAAAVDRFGDGVTGRFRAPAERGGRKAGEPLTKESTTFYAGDRDMWIFLADEDNRIEIPNRRNGRTGSLARGIFMWNSEVGSKTFGVATFLFDYMCANHIVWGSTEYSEIRIRHSTLAPERFMREIQPALTTYANSSTAGITKAIEDARAVRIDSLASDKAEWLASRFGKRVAASIETAHMLEEDRPVETVWDAVVGATAVARGIQWQDERVDLERKAGDLLGK